MKKILLLILCVFALFAVVSCDSNNLEGTTYLRRYINIYNYDDFLHVSLHGDFDNWHLVEDAEVEYYAGDSYTLNVTATNLVASKAQYSELSATITVKFTIQYTDTSNGTTQTMDVTHAYSTTADFTINESYTVTLGESYKNPKITYMEIVGASGGYTERIYHIVETNK